jgi:hypothetical protein
MSISVVKNLFYFMCLVKRVCYFEGALLRWETTSPSTLTTSSTINFFLVTLVFNSFSLPLWWPGGHKSLSMCSVGRFCFGLFNLM